MSKNTENLSAQNGLPIRKSLGAKIRTVLFGYSPDILLRKMIYRITGVVSLKPKVNSRGNVLISYIVFPFIKPIDDNLDSHTNQWECLQIAQTFLDEGYAVDIIDWKNVSFIPRKKYVYFIDIHSNLDRLSAFINKECVKILHITTAHWLFQNEAELRRLLDLQKRRGRTLKPRRSIPPSFAVENADFVTMLGNNFTNGTYSYAGKEIVHIPISTTHIFPAKEKSCFSNARNGFVWLGGAGMVHKGLDLVLEAFAAMPEYVLSICGPVSAEKDFEKEYAKELYGTSNIRYFGKINLDEGTFEEIIRSSIASISPSCSEGGGGSTIAAMHAGLIPIVSYETSVDVLNFGFLLKENTIEEIKKVVREIASAPTEELFSRSRQAWEYARANHTREAFAKAYRHFIETLEKRIP